MNSSPRRPGGSAVICRKSDGACSKSPDVSCSSPRMIRRYSGQTSPKSNPSSLRKSSTACLNSTAEHGGPRVVDEISVAVEHITVDDIIRQKMDAAWAVVCQRFNIPYDVTTQSSQPLKARSISPRKRPSLCNEKTKRPAAPNAVTHLDHALQRAMKAVPDGLKVNSPLKEAVYDGPTVNAPVKEVAGSPLQQQVGSTERLNYHTPPMQTRHRRCSEPMQLKNTTGSRAQLYISNAF